MKSRDAAESDAIGAAVAEAEPKVMLCPHCKGTGQCECPLCCYGQDQENDCREEFDTASQLRRTCRICDGLGRLDPNGLSLMEPGSYGD